MTQHHINAQRLNVLKDLIPQHILMNLLRLNQIKGFQFVEERFYEENTVTFVVFDNMNNEHFILFH